MSGKGSKRRDERYSTYTKNYDQIDWSTNSRAPRLTFSQRRELMEQVRAVDWPNKIEPGEEEKSRNQMKRSR
jgi:hypothetical protein